MCVRSVLLSGLVLLVLAGCDPLSQPESMLDEYVVRTARVLDGKAELTPLVPVPQLPRRRERVRDLPPLDVGMLDFLSLYGCELQHVIGERNSIMGRVMHPANVLDYEVRFLRAADECIGEIRSERLAARIAEVAAIKRATLPDVAWNAVWGSSEIEDLLTRSKGPLRIGHDRDMAGTMAADLRALREAVARIERDDLDVDIRALDGVYQRWHARPLAGQAVRSAALVASRLDDASRLIEARLDTRPVCARPDHRPRAAEQMRGMFMTVYVGHVQPYLAEVQRVRQEMMPPLSALANIGDAGRTPAVAGYARAVLDEGGEDNVWGHFDRAVARHTRAWQDLLGQCGMRPGQDGG